MAARRLIIVLLVLFAISIAAAAIAPKRPGTSSEDEPTSTSTDTTSDEPTPAGGTSDAMITASADDPPEVTAGVGDQLALTVETKDVTQVEIADLGLLGDATPEAPAMFDVLLREAGDIEITDAENGGIIGLIVVGGDATGESRGKQPQRVSGSEAS